MCDDSVFGIKEASANNRFLTATYEIGLATNYEYNDQNILTKKPYPSAGNCAARLEEVFTYDAVGNLLSKTDTAGRVTQYEYDGIRRVESTTDAEFHTTVMTYDAHDNIIGVTDAVGQTYQFEYDFHNRIKKITRDGPPARTRVYGYDNSGNTISIKNYDGKVTNYQYDALNRLTKTTYPNGKIATYTYDALSRMLTATDEEGTVTFSYDNRGRVRQWLSTQSYRAQYDFGVQILRNFGW